MASFQKVGGVGDYMESEHVKLIHKNSNAGQAFRLPPGQVCSKQILKGWTTTFPATFSDEENKRIRTFMYLWREEDTHDWGDKVPTYGVAANVVQLMAIVKDDRILREELDEFDGKVTVDGTWESTLKIKAFTMPTDDTKRILCDRIVNMITNNYYADKPINEDGTKEEN